jgi:hypothetical protein
MFSFLKSKAKKQEAIRQKKYKRVNIVFKLEEFEEVEKFLKSQNISLNDYVKNHLKNEMN